MMTIGCCGGDCAVVLRPVGGDVTTALLNLVGFRGQAFTTKGTEWGSGPVTVGAAQDKRIGSGTMRNLADGNGYLTAIRFGGNQYVISCQSGASLRGALKLRLRGKPETEGITDSRGRI